MDIFRLGFSRCFNAVVIFLVARDVIVEAWSGVPSESANRIGRGRQEEFWDLNFTVFMSSVSARRRNNLPLDILRKGRYYKAVSIWTGRYSPLL